MPTGLFDDIVGQTSKGTGLFDDIVPGPIQSLNPTEPSLEAQPLTLMRRLRQFPAVESLIGPEVQNPNRPVQGVLPSLLQGVSGALTSSPEPLFPRPRTELEGAEHALLSQVNPANIVLGGQLSALHGVKEAGVLGNLLKAAIATYFAKQGAEMVGTSLGERTAGVPLAPERKGQLDMDTLLGLLMSAAPAGVADGAGPKPEGVKPTLGPTLKDADEIEGRVPPERRLTQFNPTLATRGPTDLGVRPEQVPIKLLEKTPQSELGRVLTQTMDELLRSRPTEKRPSQQAPVVLGEQPILSQSSNILPSTGPQPVEVGQPFVKASQAQGEPKLGGQISFASPAEEGSIPSARQIGVQPRGLQLKPTEEQIRKKSQEGAINLQGPAEVLREFKAKVMDGTQIVNRLRNRLHPDEWGMYEDLGIVGAFGGKKVDPQEVAKWMEDNGPKVQVRKFGEGGQTPEQKTYSKLTHRFFDNQSRNQQLELNEVYDSGKLYEHLPNEDINRRNFVFEANRYLESRRKAESQGPMPDSSHWSSIAPKSEQDMPGYTEGAVVLPTRKPVGDERITGAKGEHAASSVLFPSSHSFPPNTLAFWRGYMETTPEGKKVFHVIEVQSDWAQRVREETTRHPQPEVREQYVKSHPLLRQYERLALKSAIEHAKQEGADAIAISDAETAMMTEGHDRAARRYEPEIGRQPTQFAHQDPQERSELLTVDQEPGMRLHYDQTLPRIAEELTGKKGERVEFGDHRMAEASQEDQSIGATHRSDLIFRNADNTPKTSVSARLFPVDKVSTDFSMFGKDRLKTEEVGLRAPIGKGLQTKPTEQQLKQRGQEGAINIEPLKEVAERFSATLNVLKEAYQRKQVKGDVAALSRAVDNLSLRAQNQSENHMKLTATKWFGDRADEARNAVFAVLEGVKTGGLAQALVKSKGNEVAEASVRFAMDPKNQRGLQEMVSELKKLDSQNLAMAKANGVSVPSIDDYLKHMYGDDARPFFFNEKPSPGIGMGSKAARKFPTIFDAIAAGHKPVSMDVAALVGRRTQEIFREVQTKKWLDGFRTVSDPVTKEPVVTDLGKMGLPPDGYTKVEGLNVGIKDGYKSIFSALTGESHISQNMVGQFLLEAEGGIKHGTLAFDIFHLSRVAQFARSVEYKTGYKKGLSLLEYSEKDLAEAVRQGLAPKDAVAYQGEVNDLPQGKFTNRELGSLAVQEGANVGKHSEALYTSFVRSFPGLKQTVGRFNRYVFDKVSRGAMYEANIADIKRIAEARPDLTIKQVARQVSRDLNYRFGNISKQGLVKNKTLQDLTQLMFLAPKWVESMAQSEVRSAGQVGKSLMPGQHLGTLGFSSAKLLATYLVATQAINVVFNGHTTFQNPNNKGHELDAYIPPFTKNGKGFWISPLSVVGELQHDMLRYTRGSKKPPLAAALDAGARIAGNKLSPPMQGVRTFFSGRNWKDEPVEGWDRIKEALVTGVNPTPLPVKQATTAMKEKDVAPLERQGFSMLGIKAEPESFGEVKQRKIAELGKTTLSERAKLEKELKTLRPSTSDSAVLAAGQRKMEDLLRSRNALRDELPKPIQTWLEDRKLHITGFTPEITKDKQRVTLTEAEQKWFVGELKKQYTELLTPWVGQETTQERLNSRLLQARNKARKNLINAIDSNSIIESDAKKKKRFSFMEE